MESLQRDKQRLEGELEEAERLLKVAKARHVKQGAAREEGKESKVTAAYLCCYVPRNHDYGLLEMGKVSHCLLVVCTVTSIETVWLIWDGESVPVTVGCLYCYIHRNSMANLGRGKCPTVRWLFVLLHP